MLRALLSSLLLLLLMPTGAAAQDARAEFQAICEAFRSGDDPYFGTRIVDQLRGMLERPARDPVVRVGRRARLGVELLRLGETGLALARLTEAWELADAPERVGSPPVGKQWDEIRRRLRRDLALAWLRAAEERNCLENHNAASCIVPLLPEAVHRNPEPAARAAELYDELLVGAGVSAPAEPTLLWLRAVARATAGQGAQPPWPTAGDPDFPRWRQVGTSVGLHRRDLAGGAAMDDFDGDGDLDLISSTNDPCSSMTALRNDGWNDGQPSNLDEAAFVDVTEAWGLGAQWGGLNFVHADADGDGDLDLYVLRGGWWNEYGEVRNSLLRNDLSEGRGFVDVTRAAGLHGPGAPPAPTQTAAFADADGDGDLDLYVGHEATSDRPYPSRLYRNLSEQGTLRFQDATLEAGVENLLYAKGVTWGDFDGDGDPDLYVSNLGGPNRLYRNDSSGDTLRFVDVAEEMGVTEPGSSFAIWFFDADSDGDLDLFVADYSAPYAAVHSALVGARVEGGNPRLFLNRSSRGGVGFEDASEAWGLSRPTLPMGANFGDVDSDGLPDVYLGTGVPDYEALMPNVMLRNTGAGFEDVTFVGGFGHLQKGHGVAFGDLDGDGDEDLFHQLGGQYPGDVYSNALFENPSNGPGHLTLRMRSPDPNRFAVGSLVAVRLRRSDGTHRTIHRVVGTGGSFGGNSHQVELGLGAGQEIAQVDVAWPGSRGSVSFRGLEPDTVYVLVAHIEAQDERAAQGEPAVMTSAAIDWWFDEKSGGLTNDEERPCSASSSPG